MGVIVDPFAGPAQERQARADSVGLRTFLKSDDRVEQVATFVANHFKENVLPLGYKAFLVGVDREACAKYKKALDKLLPPEWSVPIYTENAADIVDRPLVHELQVSEGREADVRLLFKKADQDPKILIITDKLLTGYDAPLLYCLYLDKPMRDHVSVASGGAREQVLCRRRRDSKLGDHLRSA